MSVGPRNVYAQLWCERSARVTLAVAALARIPTQMLPLTILLAVRARYAFLVAGTASGCFALGMGIGAPIRAHIADRHGVRRVMTLCFIGTTTALLGLLDAIEAQASPLAILCLATAAGALFPPLTVTLRVVWGQLYEDVRLRRAGLSLDTAMIDLAIIAGPPLAAVAVTALGAHATALAIAGALSVAIAAFPRTRRGAAIGAARHWRSTALSVSRLRRLAIVAMGSGLALGAVQIGLVGIALDHYARLLSGWTLGALGVGSLCGSLLFGRRVHQGTNERLVARAAALQGCATVPLIAVAAWPLAVLVLCPIAGLPVGPTFTMLSDAASGVAPAGTELEAQGWIISGYCIGEALGASVASGLRPTLSLLIAVGAALLAGALAWGMAAGIEEPSIGRCEQVAASFGPAPEPTARGLQGDGAWGDG
jgi:predicted MFS family arabinose efflux permease